MSMFIVLIRPFARYGHSAPAASGNLLDRGLNVMGKSNNSATTTEPSVAWPDRLRERTSAWPLPARLAALPAIALALGALLLVAANAVWPLALAVWVLPVAGAWLGRARWPKTTTALWFCTQLLGALLVFAGMFGAAGLVEGSYLLVGGWVAALSIALWSRARTAS